MKVTIVSSSFARGDAGYGDVLQVKRLAEGLRKVGANAKYIPMIGTKDSPIICPVSDTCTQRCINCTFAREQASESNEKLVKLALKTKADVYHIRGGSLFNAFPDTVKRVLSAVPESHFDKNVPMSTDVANFTNADDIVCFNDSSIPFFKEVFGVTPKPVYVSADTDSFKPDLEPETLVKAQPDEKLIGYIGAIQDYQGVTPLLDALVAINRSGIKTRLLVCTTNQPDAETLSHRARVLGLGDKVSIVLNTPNKFMPNLIAACDIVHLTRNFDAVYPMTPIKLLDYMSMNKPFLYAEGDKGITELWEDRNCEIGLKTSDFIETYKKALTTSPNASGMRDRLFEKKRDMESVAKAALKVYEGVI